MLIEDIQKITNGKWFKKYNNTNIEELCIDSRKIVSPNLSVFVGLKGERRSGAVFSYKAYEKGIRNYLLDEEDIHHINSEWNDVNVITVPDTLIALQNIGTNIRLHHHYPVIAITGSNGKTIIKEWLSNILSTSSIYNSKSGIVKSPKSYNSQIGVPLSIWNMEVDNTIGIFEAGISKKGEMRILENIIQPTIGLFTNLGDAHDDYFQNRTEKLLEKLQLFSRCKTLIIQHEILHIPEAIAYLNEVNPTIQFFTWSKSNAAANILIEKITNKRNSSSVIYNYNNQIFEIDIPFTQDAYIENVINVLCTLIYLEVPFELIKQGIAQLKAVAMRMEVNDAINNSYVISDTYNSDLSSLKVGLAYLSEQINKSKTLILSDMLESGKSETQLAIKISQLIRDYNVNKFIGIGEKMMQTQSIFIDNNTIECHFYPSTDTFISEYPTNHFNNEYILLKGARIFEFERIQNLLELKVHQTVMEIDLEALSDNLSYYKSHIQPQTKVMAMVKAFSYGHGGIEIAQKLEYEKIDYLTVAYVDEGIELRIGGITTPIMVMSPEIQSFESMIRWNLEPEIFNFRSLKMFIEAANKYQEIHYPIHIKLNTGMHRLGFEQKDIDEMLQLIKQTDSVKIASIFSHLVASEDASQKAFTNLQYERYNHMSQMILDNINYTPLKHICNSAGIFNEPDKHMDMVRLGIGLYGVDSSDKRQNKLQQISTLKTYIVQIRNVPKEETVGYNKKGILHRDSIIATVAIGYADGYSRAFATNGGYMLINNQKAPIIGNICMDMCMLDITDISNVHEGDEVIVFGKKLPVNTVASWANTIGYELLTSISRRVKRSYINN